MANHFDSERFFAALRQRDDLNAIVGGADARAVGEGHLHFLRREGLPDRPAVLCDLGCGVGRTLAAVLEAAPLESTALGVDVLPQLLDFCDVEIANRRPGTEFRWLKKSSVHYDQFNPTDTSRASFDENSVVEGYVHRVDFLWAISVITHLDDHGALPVLRLIGRLLQPSGVAVVTCFIMDRDSEACVRRGTTSYDLSRGQWDGAVFQGAPEDEGAFVAHTFNGLQELFVDAGLYMQRMVAGTWRDSSRDAHTFHDVMVLRRSEDGGLGPDESDDRS